METGAASGVSSAVVLQALRRNGQGHLWSIDLPDYDRTWVGGALASGAAGIRLRNLDNRLPPGMESGWAVPSHLREAWTLIAGDTKTELPRLLGRVPAVDFAIHDSDHTEEAILREGGLLAEHLRPGGILVVDDVDLNRGLETLLMRTPWSASVVFGRVGIARR